MLNDHILALGDIVKLKKPYRPEEWTQHKPDDWKGFEFGLVVEMLDYQFTVNGECYGNAQIPRTVSLHLYDSTGQLFIPPQWIERGLLIPEYVDYHISQLILYKIATEQGYSPITEPPDWKQKWNEEMAILKEFEG